MKLGTSTVSFVFLKDCDAGYIGSKARTHLQASRISDQPFENLFLKSQLLSMDTFKKTLQVIFWKTILTI